MASVSIRELSRNASGVVREVTRTGRPALVTKRGAPVAAVIPLDAEELEDFILSKTPEILSDLQATDRDMAAGETVSLEDALAQLKAE
jgi:prevent-host-death family protein